MMAVWMFKDTCSFWSEITSAYVSNDSGFPLSLLTLTLYINTKDIKLYIWT